MTDTAMPTQEILGSFSLSDPVFVVKTGIATVWRVERADGTQAALKLYHGATMGNEGAGFAYLKALKGVGAAQVFAYGDRFALTERLPGPSLGDLSRRGADDTATSALLTVAQTLHTQPVTSENPLPTLADWFEALFKLDIASGCPATPRRHLERCRALAAALLATPQDCRPLHGDLHHDNVRLAARGYCAFDAKGVVGERAYELANAFRNPKGAPALPRNPNRIRALRDVWSEALGVPPRRLMHWAAVKCALSIVWRSGPDCVAHDDEFDLLARFLAISEED